ncbi:MAG: hypothetical protein JXA37_08120 [Chloroflexia bacterium]|nr:hypothetical protein [Chloroflexia bacterium]
MKSLLMLLCLLLLFSPAGGLPPGYARVGPAPPGELPARLALLAGDLFALPQSGPKRSLAHPPAWQYPALAYDPVRRLSVLYLTNEWQSACWAYDGQHWQELPSPPYLEPGYAMAYDASRQVVLLGGRSDRQGATWEYGAGQWAFAAGFALPRAAMTYDEARQLTVAFGGIECEQAYCPSSDRTWEYNGQRWQPITTTHTPAARVGHALAYDTAQGHTLLFGGITKQEYAGDTWRYDGQDWQPLPSLQSPSARSGHAMVYDASRQVIILFGGYDQNGYRNDTWEYDGQNWRRLAPPDAPAARTAHAMVYDQDREVLLLFGGHRAGEWFNDVWEYDGTNWRQVSRIYHSVLPFLGRDWAIPQDPPAAYSPAMTYAPDRQTTVLYAGWPTWEYQEQEWKSIATSDRPQLDAGYRLAYDRRRGRAVLCGLRGNYTGQTWEFDGSNWRWTAGAPFRTYGGMVYDQARDRLLYFGGKWCEKHGCLYFDQTWVYSGTSWQVLETAISPPARAGQAMAYDADRGAVLLFGGSAGGRLLADTWLLDQEWRCLSPETSPPARGGGALVYDRSRGVLLLFGGYGQEGYLDDTWAFDGSTWRQLNPPLSPPARADHTLAFDQERQVVLLYGGHDEGPGPAFADTWEFDGLTWRQVAP